MRLLVLDHFYAHDIEALADALAPGDNLRVMPYEELRAEAMRIFPETVAAGLEPFTRDEFAGQRERFAAHLERLLADEFVRAPFDAFVVPSDSFFYVRAAPQACRALGVSFFCVQKETTISPNTMVAHAEETRRYAPFIADHMVVCSERHKEFWIRAGTDSACIEVTGQPRFDLYLQPHRWPVRAPEPTVLFFSYMLDAYHPEEGTAVPAWQRLHRETETGLAEVARQGWRVVIKPHPQQVGLPELKARLASELGPEISQRVRLAGSGEDARRLVVTSDVVVGFQSTALIETLAAGVPVVYTGWDPLAAELQERLIPFHEWDGALTVVRDAQQLSSAILHAREHQPTDAERAQRARIVADELGPIDGHASERALAAVRVHAERARAACTPEVERHRDALRRRRTPVDPGRRARAGMRALRRSVGAALGR